MSNFPNSFDDDTTLPAVNDNITEAGGDAINALRDFAFNTEQYLGLGANGSTSSIAARLGISLNPDGTIKPSAIASLGLVTLPITQDQISATANIPESKLALDHKTQDLFNYISDLFRDVNEALGWINVSGVKLEPHLAGQLYRHTLDQIDVSTNLSLFPFLKNKFRLTRNNSQSYNLVNDINNELLAHQWADGVPFGPVSNVTTNDGSIYPSSYAHVASGIFLESQFFGFIPQSIQDVQSLAEFLDQASIFLLGTRIQNLYANGISATSRSDVLNKDGYGQLIVPPTPAIAYLSTIGSPSDDILTGDDIIKFVPANGDGFAFDAQFALVKVGDIVRVNYGTVEVQFVIKEKKTNDVGGQRIFTVRIAGKNLFNTTTAIASINRPLFNANKYGVLAAAAANNYFAATSASIQPSLIVGSPRGAQALGLGFNPDQFDSTHYLLYLALFPTGNPSDGYTILPGVDVTGNQGSRPGSYTLQSIVEATNNAFRQPGFNYRFIAFSYQGEFGIMLADSYNNAGFSILSAVVSPTGVFDPVATANSFPNNVVGIFPPANGTAPDPLGFGFLGANIASPAFMQTYGSAAASQNPTKLFIPLRRNSYYVNGTERDRLALDVEQTLDQFGDSYWAATIDTVNVIPGSRVEVTYKIPLDLSTSKLKAGKTIVVQSLEPGSSLADAGRFLIKSVLFECSPNVDTKITVYDAAHATGVSPPTSTSLATVGTSVAIYFDSDSVSFNAENSSDLTGVAPFKRYFESFIDQNGATFTSERARIYVGTFPPGQVVPPFGGYVITNGGANRLFTSYNGMQLLNILSVSPKLRGYQYGLVNKITLTITSFDTASGVYTGYLARFDDIGFTYTNQGPLITGKQGQITRFYDDSNVDYVDILFDVNASLSIVPGQVIDIQLFPTLSLDDELMPLNSCQVSDQISAPQVTYLTDRRQFGNVSEKHLSTSAISFLSTGERLLHQNGVVRGFDLETNAPNPNNGQIFLTGGNCLVNGNFVLENNETVVIPIVKEKYSGLLYNINWVLCVNDKGEYQPIPLLDFDPVLGTPNNPDRLVTLYNANTAVTYNADSSTFSDIINRRKDLVPLYIVSSTVTGSNPASISLTIRDVRKYVKDSDSSTPAVLTTSDPQGNFLTLDSALNWLQFNNAFQNEIQVKGAYTLNADLGNMNYLLNIHAQAPNSSISFNGAMNVSNVTFRDLSLTFHSSLTGSNLTFYNCTISVLSANLTNCTFYNCTFTTGRVGATLTNVKFDNCTTIVNQVLSATTAVFTDGSFRVNGSATCNGIKLDSCPFTITSNATLTSADVRGGSLSITGTSNISSSSIVNSSVTLAASNLTTTKIHDSSVTVGGTITVGTNSQFTNCSVQVNALQGFALNPFVGFIRCTFSYGVNPVGQPGYNTTDLVNASSGMMYANVTSSLSGIKIWDCIFNYSLTDHFPMISIQASSYSAIISDISIRGNEFNSQVSNHDDLRAVVAFTSTLTSQAAAGAYPKQPRLANVYIDNNTCSDDQLILVSVVRLAGGGSPIAGAPFTTSSVSISSNNCGAIGFLTSGGDTANFADNIKDKREGLTINNNTCKLISNLDHRGGYIAFRPIAFPTNGIDWVQIGTGSFTVSQNTANWISVGCSSYTSPNDGCVITSNKVSPNSSLYLSNYLDTLNSNLSPPNVGILLRAEFNGTGSTHSMISENIIQQKPFFNSDGTTTLGTYYYDCGLACMNNAHVVNNTINGVVNNSSDPIIFLGDRIIGSVTGNILIRNSLPVSAYISVHTNTTFNAVNVVNNFFDSSYIDAANTIETVGVNIPDGWTFSGNKNQISYLAVPKAPYVTLRATQPPPRSSFKESGLQPESNQYTTHGTAGDATTINSNIPFVDPLVLSPDALFVIQNGVTSVSFGNVTGWNITGTYTEIVGALIQFDDNDDYYQITTPVTGSGSNVQSFTLVRAYEGLTNPACTNVKVYSPTGSPPISHLGTLGTVAGTYFIRMDINDLLPPGVQILSVAVGVFAVPVTNLAPGSEFVLQASASQSAQYSLTSLNGTIVDVATSPFANGYPGAVSTTMTIGSGPGQVTPSQIQSATQYLTLDLSAVSGFVTGKNKIIMIGYSVGIGMSAGSGGSVVDSPVTVRYKW